MVWGVKDSPLWVVRSSDLLLMYDNGRVYFLSQRSREIFS
jgi:hypothetical protein